MCPARSRYPDRKYPVREAFLGLPLPDDVLPDAGTVHGSRNRTDERDETLTEASTTCPDGLVEEVLWGLLHGLTAPVTGGIPDSTGSSEAQRA